MSTWHLQWHLKPRAYTYCDWLQRLKKWPENPELRPGIESGTLEYSQYATENPDRTQYYLVHWCIYIIRFYVYLWGDLCRCVWHLSIIKIIYELWRTINTIPLDYLVIVIAGLSLDWKWNPKPMSCAIVNPKSSNIKVLVFIMVKKYTFSFQEIHVLLYIIN